MMRGLERPSSALRLRYRGRGLPLLLKPDHDCSSLTTHYSGHVRLTHGFNGNGPKGRPLFGIPVIVKDNIDTADMPTTAGSLALGTSRPQSDAFIVQKLRRAGAVIIGKATLTEFANFLTTGMPAGYS